MCICKVNFFIVFAIQNKILSLILIHKFRPPKLNKYACIIFKMQFNSHNRFHELLLEHTQ